MKAQAIALAVLLSASSLYAQTATGTIQGAVVDSSHAYIPGARVTVTEAGTNQSRLQTTGSTGSFEFRALPIGTYSVQVDDAGFARSVLTGVVLDVAQTKSLDVMVKPASTSETVEVGSSAALLQITDSSLSSVINQDRVETLPLNGRNVLQLTQFAAGITTSAKASATERQANYGPAFVVGGQRDNANEVLIDGVEVSGMELNNYPLAIPSLDDVEEFNVQTSNYPAEFGGNSGAFINIVTKRGANSFHGSLFEFVRNTDLDAKNYFAAAPSVLHRNQFGGTVGGPVILPRLYNGRNRTFWFFSYEGTRQRTAIVSTAIVPTLLERMGDFSQTGTVIVDPITKIPYNNDRITNINPVGQALLNLYPLPNLVTTSATNYSGSPSQIFDNDLKSGRVDQQVTARDSAFAKFTINSPFTVAPSVAAFTGYNGITQDWNLQVAAGNTFVVTSHIVNESTFGYVKFERSKGSQAANTQDFVTQLGIQGFNPPPYAWASPSIAPLGLSTVGYTAGSAVYNWASSSRQFVDNLSIDHGKHTLKAGATVNIKTLQSTQYTSPNGAYTFNGEFTAVNAVASTTSANAIADLLTGYPSGYSLNAQPYHEDFTYTFLGTYFQDDWKPTSNLSFNLGLRWEYFAKPADKNNQIATFNLLTGTQVVAGTTPLPLSLIYQDKTDFSPRLGFGYRLPGKGQTSIRGAYGLFYSPEVINTFRNLGFQNPFGTTYTLSVRPANPIAPQPAFTVQNPLAGATPAVNTATVLGIKPHFKDSYSGEWNLTLQHTFGKDTLLEIAYRGSSTQHLTSELNYNLTNPFPAQPPTFSLNYPYPAFSTVNYFDSNGSGNYNGVQIRVQKQVSHGLEILANYTFDKNMTNIDQSSVGSSSSPGNAYAAQTLNLHQNYGWAVQGRPQEFVLSAIYAVPFFANTSTALKEVGAGWSIGIDSTFAGGSRLTPSSYGVSYVGTRANITGNPNLPRGQRTINRWYNTATVTNPAPGSLGNAAKGSIKGSGTNLSNLVLIKNFKLPGTNVFEFRSEFFNVFNHTQFDDPYTYANTYSLAGKITSANDYGYAQTERVLQLALKYKF
jgi:hypothetical protein